MKAQTMSFADQSDPTLNPRFRAFWTTRDRFFREQREVIPPNRSSIALRSHAADDDGFLGRLRAELRREVSR